MTFYAQFFRSSWKGFEIGFPRDPGQGVTGEGRLGFAFQKLGFARPPRECEAQRNLRKHGAKWADLRNSLGRPGHFSLALGVSLVLWPFFYPCGPMGPGCLFSRPWRFSGALAILLSLRPRGPRLPCPQHDHLHGFGLTGGRELL